MPLRFGALSAHFAPGGALTLAGQGWPSFAGSWQAEGDTLLLKTSGGPAGCEAEARYRFRRDGSHVSFELVKDDCAFRRMMLDRSRWVPQDEPRVIPERRIVHTALARSAALPAAAPAAGSW